MGIAPFFRHTDFLRFKISKKFFLKIWILGIIEKCIGWFLVYLFLGVFLLKVQNECVCVIMLFLLLVLFKIYFLMCKKGISRLLSSVAAKPTASINWVGSSSAWIFGVFQVHFGVYSSNIRKLYEFLHINCLF